LNIDGGLISKTITSNYYFVKAFPTIALDTGTAVTNQFTVKISNNTTKPMTITSFSGAGTSGLVYVSDQERNYSLAANEYVTINPTEFILATFKVTAA
jgi:hypothetical protein